MDIDIREIEIGLVCANSGQLADVPMNYRKITAENLHALEKSLKDCPELLAMRPLITIEHDGKFVALSGNHRLRAAANIGMETVPCIVLPPDTFVNAHRKHVEEKQREYAAKDNLEYAETVPELLAMWNVEELQEWNVHVDIEVPDVEIVVKPPKEKAKKQYQCPKCGFKWNV